MAGLVTRVATVIMGNRRVMIMVGVMRGDRSVVVLHRWFRDDHAAVPTHARRRAQHGRGQRTPNGEHHGQHDQEPDAQKIHGEERIRSMCRRPAGRQLWKSS